MATKRAVIFFSLLPKPELGRPVRSTEPGALSQPLQIAIHCDPTCLTKRIRTEQRARNLLNCMSLRAVRDGDIRITLCVMRPVPVETSWPGLGTWLHGAANSDTSIETWAGLRGTGTANGGRPRSLVLRSLGSYPMP